jgi:hypothetical protein
MSRSAGTADILNKIKKIYANNDGYMAKYGSDVWATVILCIVFIITIGYYHSNNVLEVVRADWPNQRCNPLYMPFAGYINKPTNQTNLEFTMDNFGSCVHSMLSYVTNIAVQPIQYAMSALNKACYELVKSFNEFRDLIKHLRDKYKTIFIQIFSSVAEIVVTFMGFVINLKDILAKIQGILTASLYSIFGAYLTMQSLFLSIINFITAILRIIQRIIFVFIGISEDLDEIPIIGYMLSIPPMLLALPVVLAMTAIYIPMLLFQMGLSRAMGLSTPMLPGIPSCFAGDTSIKLAGKNGSKKIKDIVIGDVLENGAKVTAVLKLAAADQDVYNLNGVLVSGEHRILLGKSWLNVKDHPASIHVPEFNEPFLYCLNTDKKCFTIADATYSDWDDIDDKVLADLKQNCVDLPANFGLADIHSQLDYGFHGNKTFVKLMDGTILPISSVKVNDVLASGDKACGDKACGDRVRGVIKIAAHDMVTYNHLIEGGGWISGSKNIHLAANHLGIMASVPAETHEVYLYHLLTDTSFFVVNDIRVRDYNSGIDAYLSQ